MKIKKYQFVTLLLVSYALFMTFYFGIDLLKEGQTLRFWGTLSAELLVITLAYFALKRRDQYRQQRNNRKIES